MADLIDRAAVLEICTRFPYPEGIARAIKDLPAQGVRVKPTDAQVASACMSYRHDFGLLSEDERKTVMFQAREWLHAWQKELAALSPAEVEQGHGEPVQKLHKSEAPAPDAVEALVKAAGELNEIVEGITGAMEHGTWRDEHGSRFKDTPEWVAFYNALAAIREGRG